MFPCGVSLLLSIITDDHWLNLCYPPPSPQTVLRCHWTGRWSTPSCKHTHFLILHRSVSWLSTFLWRDIWFATRHKHNNNLIFTGLMVNCWTFASRVTMRFKDREDIGQNIPWDISQLTVLHNNASRSYNATTNLSNHYSIVKFIHVLFKFIIQIR